MRKLRSLKFVAYAIGLAVILGCLSGNGCGGSDPFPTTTGGNGSSGSSGGSSTGGSTGGGSGYSQLAGKGCFAAAAGGYNQFTILPGTGNPQVDQILNAEYYQQQSFWGLPTSAWIFDDRQSPNALSSPEYYMLFGITFIGMIWSSYGFDAVAGVMAHEFAHQAQFRILNTNMQGQAKPYELEADAFSGFYMYFAKNSPWNNIQGYFQAIAALGDFNFTHQGHHGTPEERVNAALLGFQTADSYRQGNRQPTYHELHEIFSASLRTRMPNVFEGVAPEPGRAPVDPSVLEVIEWLKTQPYDASDFERG